MGEGKLEEHLRKLCSKSDLLDYDKEFNYVVRCASGQKESIRDMNKGTELVSDVASR